jgi:ubiquinone/menaquinone biosynthesis C-methylase UbiE
MKNSKYSKIKKYYDDYGSWYDDERIEGYYSFINEIEIDTISKYSEDKKVLEIGCGTGIILDRISKSAKDAWGVDLSSGMLKKAKEKGLNVKQANATKLPFEDDSFDVVYSVKVLAHIPEIKKVISEVHRVLRDDGVAVLEFYNPYSFKYLANKIQKSGDSVYLRFDSLADVRSLFGNRFEIIGTTGARIITITSSLLKIPVLDSVIPSLEKSLRNSPIRHFAGYLIVTARKVS